MAKKALYVVAVPFAFDKSRRGGFISHAKGVIDGLQEHGYHVDIATDLLIPGINYSNPKVKYIYYPFRFIRRQIPVRSVVNVKGLLTKVDNFLFQLCMKSTLINLFNTQEYDFMYLRASYNGHKAAEMAKSYNTPLILEVNRPLSMGPYNRANGLPWPKKKNDVFVHKCERIQYDIARLITIDSPLRGKWITDFVDERYRQKMIINPSGVDSTMFRPKRKGFEKRKELGIRDEQIVIGMASSFRWYNDVEELSQIMKEVKRESDNVLFLLAVGDLGRIKAIQKAVQKHNVSDSVLILPQVPFMEMPYILDICNILISYFNFHGKWPHNCSIKHMEYLAMGKPVVATRAGYVNYAIENNVNGFLIEEGDKDGFIKAILKLINDKDLCKKFGDNGRLKAEKELTWHKNTEEFLTPLMD